MYKRKDSASGFSMMELVISIAIIGIFFVSIGTIFKAVNKAILVTRTRTVATNLTQEKIESLKNISYSRLRSTSLNDSLACGYDNTFYPPESGILIGNIPYERKVLVQRVKEDAAGKLVEVLPDAGDTGLKKITVTISWQEEGKSKSFSLSSLREDPNRRPLNGTIAGTIYDQDTTAVVSGVSVSVIDHLNWSAATDNMGLYSIKVPTGTYTIRATKDGYWPRDSAELTISETGTPPCNLQLKKIATGSATGYVFVNDHPVISKVVASTVTALGEDLEWVELFNPTNSPIPVTGSSFWIAYVNEFGNYDYKNVSWGNLQVITPQIPARGYYLIAATGTVRLGDYAVTADAIYTDADPGGFITADKKGAVIIWYYNGTDWKTDYVGWAPSAENAPLYEIKAIKNSNGLDVGKTHVRYSYPGHYASNLGNAFDSDVNEYNFVKNHDIGDAAPEYYPKNASYTGAVVSGYPAFNAVISCDDMVSSPVNATTVDPSGYRLAYFSLPCIATGTWTMSFIQNGAYAEIGNVQVLTPGTTVQVTNASTSPSWLVPGLHYVILDGIATNGVVKGQVKSNYAGVSGIKVESGTNFTYSQAGGYYTLSLLPGTYNITANPGNMNANYTSQTLGDIAVTQGQFVSNINFDISPGGTAGGRVISNSGDYLSDILVVAYDKNDNETASALTQADGIFTLSNLATSGNPYSIKPVLDAGESADPADRQVNVAAGDTAWTDSSGMFSSFTVTSAFGTIKGSVSDNGHRIGTGVLVLATTSTISGTPDIVPPDIDNAVRTGGSIYYGTVSHSDGTYTLQVRGGSHQYNVYAWYTTYPGTHTTAKSSSNHPVAAGETITVDFTWP